MARNRVISAVLTLKDKDFGSTVKKSASATKDLERKVKSTGNAVSQFSRSATTGFTNVAKSVLGLVAAYAGISAIKEFSVSMVESAASMQALSSQFEQVFGADAGEARGVIKNLGKEFGMVPERIKPAFTQMTSMFKGLGLKTGEAMDQSMVAINLVADAAAFYDKSFEDANSALNSFIKGNYEGGEAIGLFANETQLASWASKNLKVDWKKLDEAGKQVARLQFAQSMQKAAGATGQAARESDGYENVLGNLRQSWDTLKGKLGEPILGPAVKGMQSLSDWLGKIDTDSITNGFSRFGSGVASAFNFIKPGLVWIKDTGIPGIKDGIVKMYTASQPGLNWMKDTAFPAVRDGIGFVLDKSTELYNFISGNWSLIGPVIAGVTASVAAFKIGVIAVTAAQNIWKGVTTGLQLATALLNGTLAISPLGWVALAIGAVVTAGIALWKNWDTVKEKAGHLWDTAKEVGAGIQDAFSSAWDSVKTAAEISINFVIDRINGLIKVINKIPGVNVPIIAKVDWSAAESAGSGPKGNKMAGNAVMATYAVGTNRVERDQVAQIHKDEMIIPAAQSRNLRRQGVTIDNIDKARPLQSQTVMANTSSQNQGNLLSMIAELIQMIKNMPKGDVNVTIDGYNKSVTEIINELVPLLKSRLSNM
ncbi:hypothetical protein [Heyndrickxia oleronia]|uniref:hypothetical protein n=1 Tax=Heyndrickxia oleronia TaxID=38875 RepID=UPI00242BAAEC|nr:hypothetical protein [Heyndrickxia oleronia]MCI1593213.1 hypothetical protein [Heyndrickxia oleronia]MCI1615454.1 hypothetical protein [Heyndrickxia oleronia]MCI1746196.1 hypothetical protein [Heyndrickxia oleronia]MCI1763579.1 hypothetical protein [Heyndrickxia oleronia]